MTFAFKNVFSFDSFRSLLTGLGVPGRDKVMSLSPSGETITYSMRDLENLYRGNWLAKKIVDIPAFDCTRSWRTWDAEDDVVEKLEDSEKEFGLQRKMLDAMIKSRLYGGSAMIMGIRGQLFNEELDLGAVKEGDLKFVHVVEKWMLQAGPRVRDITSPWFGEPSYYMRSNIPIPDAPGDVTKLPSSSLGYKPGETIFIHPSRVVRMVGIEYPDVEHSPDAWGDSVLASIYEAIRDAGLVTQSLANLIADAKVDVFHIPGLTSTLSTQAGTDKLISYLANANVAKSVVNSLVIDKEIEWERIQTHFEGLPQVLQAYLLICSAGADIPSTRMLSREPSGQNATGESDTRNYYDRLSSEQAVVLTPTLSRLDEVLIRHALGRRPKEVKYDWNPLWQMTDTEKADIALKKAQAYQIDVNTALIPAQALVIGRQNQLIEDGVYPGLATAIDDLEKNWEEEAEFLPIQQMGQQKELQEGSQEHQSSMQQESQEHQKEMFSQQSESGDDDDDEDKKFGDSQRRLRFIRRMMDARDENFQQSLGFMVPGQGQRRKRTKRPFAGRQSDPDPDVNFGPNDPDAERTEDSEFEEELHPRERGRFAPAGRSKTKISRFERISALGEGNFRLSHAAQSNAPFEEARSLLNGTVAEVMEEQYGDLKKYYEKTVVPEMKGTAPEIRLAAGKEFLVGYHGTTKEVFLQAQKEGLKPQGSKGADEWAAQNDMAAARQFTIGDRKMSVYMAADPHYAASFAKIASSVRKQTPTLLEIRIPKEFVDNIVGDTSGPTDFFGNPAFIRYKGIIKPEWIVKELPFEKYKEGSPDMGIVKGETGEYSAVHLDSDTDFTTIYAILFDPLPMEMHDVDWDEGKHPRGEHGKFGEGSHDPHREILKGEPYKHLLPPTARTKAGAEDTYYKILEKDQPLFYHESPGDISKEIKREGIKGGYGVFAAVGQPSEFVTSPIKTIVSFKIPKDRMREISPDMGMELFEGDVGRQKKELEPLTAFERSLIEYPDRLKGVYVSTNFEKIPRSWIKSIEVKRPDREPESKLPSGSRVYLDPNFNQWRFEITRNGSVSHLSAGYHSKEEAIEALNKNDRWGSKDSIDPNSELPRHGHENDPIDDEFLEDDWSEAAREASIEARRGEFNKILAEQRSEEDFIPAVRFGSKNQLIRTGLLHEEIVRTLPKAYQNNWEGGYVLRKATAGYPKGTFLSHEQMEVLGSQGKLVINTDADWDETKHPRGQPTNAGEFGAGGGSAKESKIASRDVQANSINGIIDYLRKVSSLYSSPEGMTSKHSFILQHGTPYIANAKTYAGAKGPIKRCYMNAAHVAMDTPDRTYVEGFVTVHGVPIEHAWTVDSKGQIYDNTIRPDANVSGYFGVPFTKAYLTTALGKNEVYGLLGHESRKTLEPLLRGQAKNFKESPDPDKLTSDVIADRLSFADRTLSSIPITENLNSSDRIQLRDNIVDALYNRDMAKRTKNRKATIVFGLPGSGKSTISNPLVKSGRLEIESDNAKAMLPEFQGGVGAYAVHEESSKIMRRVLAKAIQAGDDIVWPRIDSQDKIVKDVKSLKDAGYDVEVKFVDVPQPVAVHSAITRFLKMGRYVSPQMIVGYGNSPRESYDAAIATGLLSGHQRYIRGSGKGFVEVKDVSGI